MSDQNRRQGGAWRTPGNQAFPCEWCRAGAARQAQALLPPALYRCPTENKAGSRSTKVLAKGDAPLLDARLASRSAAGRPAAPNMRPRDAARQPERPAWRFRRGSPGELQQPGSTAMVKAVRCVGCRVVLRPQRPDRVGPCDSLRSGPDRSRAAWPVPRRQRGEPLLQQVQALVPAPS